MTVNISISVYTSPLQQACHIRGLLTGWAYIARMKDAHIPTEMAGV
jgi:hypothetical protein